MKKKIILVLLTVLAVTALFSGALSAAIIMPHGVGDDHTDMMEWNTANSLPASSRQYYLSTDVTLSDNWVIDGKTIILCLNGHVVNLNGKHIEIKNSGNLMICDCNATTKHYFNKDASGLWTLASDQTVPTDYVVIGGVVTGGIATNGGAVSVSTSGLFAMAGGTLAGNKATSCGGGIHIVTGTLTMTGGVITGNTASNGGGVHVQGECTASFTGGVITGNTATQNGGGVYNERLGTKVGGTVRITGNLAGAAGSRKENNLFISFGCNLSLASPKLGMCVGINMASPGIFVEPPSNPSSYIRYFRSDSDAYIVNSYFTSLKLDTLGSIVVRVSPTDYGVIYTDKQSYSSGNPFTLTLVPDAGCYLKEGTFVVTKDGTPVATPVPTKDGSGHLIYKYTGMADGTYTVSAVFSQHTHDGEEGTYTPWTKTNALPTSADLTTGTDYFYLTDNVTLSGNWTIGSGRDVVLCLNSKVLNLNGHFIQVDNGGKLTICNCNTNTGHKFGDNDGLWTWDDSLVGAEMKHVVGGGVITGGSGYCGGAVYANGGTFVLNGGILAGNEAHQGGAVFVGMQGNFTMNGGNILGNTASMLGGGVYTAESSTVTLAGGSIGYNKSVYNGGGVYSASSTVIMSNCSISNNTAGDRGGGVYMTSSTLFTMSGGIISGNKAGAAGGGVSVYNSTFIMQNDAAISGNTSKTGGGGLLIEFSGTFRMVGGTVTDNTTEFIGGGIMINAGTVKLGKNARITGNTAGEEGSKTANNVYLKQNQTVTFGVGTDAPVTGMLVGVTTAVVPTSDAPVAITTNGTADDAKYFVSDVTGPKVEFVTDHIALTAEAAPGPGPEPETHIIFKKGKVAQIPDQFYTGSEIVPALTVTYQGKTLTEGKDYKVTCRDNIKPGLATVYVTFRGEYSGMVRTSFTIVPCAVDATAIAPIGDQPYMGSPITPPVTVTVSGRTLTEGTDYTVAYANNTAAGKATVTVTFTGYYTGTVEVPFKIAAKGASSVRIEPIGAQTYTGSPITPAVKVTDGNVTLTEGKDYTVSYRENTNVGTAIVAVVLTGDYAGTAETTFAITPKTLGNDAIEKIGSQEWTGAAITPAVKVTDGNKVLADGTDYTVTYANNTEVGKATVTVTLCGNYAGTLNGEFTIVEVGASVDEEPTEDGVGGWIWAVAAAAVVVAGGTGAYFFTQKKKAASGAESADSANGNSESEQ